MPATMKQMCETIVAADLLRRNGTAPTAIEVFEYSPTGELFEVFGWYYAALCVLVAKGRMEHWDAYEEAHDAQVKVSRDMLTAAGASATEIEAVLKNNYHKLERLVV